MDQCKLLNMKKKIFFARWIIREKPFYDTVGGSTTIYSQTSSKGEKEKKSLVDTFYTQLLERDLSRETQTRDIEWLVFCCFILIVYKEIQQDRWKIVCFKSTFYKSYKKRKKYIIVLFTRFWFTNLYVIFSFNVEWRWIFCCITVF